MKYKVRIPIVVVLTYDVEVEAQSEEEARCIAEQRKPTLPFKAELLSCTVDQFTIQDLQDDEILASVDQFILQDFSYLDPKLEEDLQADSKEWNKITPL